MCALQNSVRRSADAVVDFDLNHIPGFIHKGGLRVKCRGGSTPGERLPIAERAGLPRYYIRVADKIEWADQPEDLMQQHSPRPEDLPPGFEAPRPISVRKIPGPGLYLSELRSKPAPLP